MSVPKHPIIKLLAVLSFYYISNAQSAPQGGVVVGGSGHIQQQNLTTNIKQTTQALAIDWNSFNINQNETVTFHQPDTSSIALNRILNHSGSQIHGQINANKRISLLT